MTLVQAAFFVGHLKGGSPIFESRIHLLSGSDHSHIPFSKVTFDVRMFLFQWDMSVFWRLIRVYGEGIRFLMLQIQSCFGSTVCGHNHGWRHGWFHDDLLWINGGKTRIPNYIPFWYGVSHDKNNCHENLDPMTLDPKLDPMVSEDFKKTLQMWQVPVPTRLGSKEIGPTPRLHSQLLS